MGTGLGMEVSLSALPALWTRSRCLWFRFQPLPSQPDAMEMASPSCWGAWASVGGFSVGVCCQYQEACALHLLYAPWQVTQGPSQPA